MNPRRLVIVIRQFWPHSGSAQLAVADLSVALRQAGHDVQIITAKMEKNWPTNFDLRETPVTRVSKPTIGPWSAFRYQRSLGQFLANMPTPDGVIVFGIDEEIATVCKAFVPLTPVVARVDYRISPYSTWQNKLNKKTRLGIQNLHAIVADSTWSSQQLVRHGIESSRTKVLADHVFVDQHQQRSDGLQTAARRSLTDAHPILAMDADQPMVVTGAAIDDDGGLNDLIRAWPIVQKSFPRARLWILGDGPRTSELWNLIKSLDLVYSVILPGYFDEPSEVFRSADLYVHPLRTGRACSFLLRAMAEGLCSVSTETEFTRDVAIPGETALVTPPENPLALAEAIIHALKECDLRNQLGMAGKLQVAKQFAIENLVKEYEEIFEFCDVDSLADEPRVSASEK